MIGAVANRGSIDRIPLGPMTVWAVITARRMRYVFAGGICLFGFEYSVDVINFVNGDAALSRFFAIIDCDRETSQTINQLFCFVFVRCTPSGHDPGVSDMTRSVCCKTETLIRHSCFVFEVFFFVTDDVIGSGDDFVLSWPFYGWRYVAQAH